MAHFCQLDENNVVTQVIVVDNKDCADATGVEKESIRCSVLRETYLAVHGSRPVITAFRKNYAGLGYTYNTDIDAFVPPQPFASWLLNETTAQWEAPVAMPADAGTGEPPKRYSWDEATTSWVEQGA
jgi:hypothetical protein